jgi:ElaB/YqjD/DUF883 family membrane-anchored ribosome-binding protein
MSTPITPTITTTGKQLAELVAQDMATHEINVRKSALASVVQQLRSEQRQLANLGPDVLSFDAEGKPARQEYSKSRAEARNASKQRIEKLEKAIEDVVERDDFTQVWQITGYTTTL